MDNIDPINELKVATDTYGVDFKMFKKHTNPVPDASAADLASIHIRGMQVMRDSLEGAIELNTERQDEKIQILEGQIEYLKKLIETLTGFIDARVTSG